MFYAGEKGRKRCLLLVVFACMVSSVRYEFQNNADQHVHYNFGTISHKQQDWECVAFLVEF